MPLDPANRPGVTVRLLDEDAPPADPSSVNDYDSYAEPDRPAAPGS